MVYLTNILFDLLGELAKHNGPIILLTLHKSIDCDCKFLLSLQVYEFVSEQFVVELHVLAEALHDHRPDVTR